MVKRRSGGSGGVAVARGHLVLVLALAEDPQSTEVKKDWMEGSRLRPLLFPAGDERILLPLGRVSQVVTALVELRRQVLTCAKAVHGAGGPGARRDPLWCCCLRGIRRHWRSRRPLVTGSAGRGWGGGMMVLTSARRAAESGGAERAPDRTARKNMWTWHTSWPRFGERIRRRSGGPSRGLHH